MAEIWFQPIWLQALDFLILRCLLNYTCQKECMYEYIAQRPRKLKIAPRSRNKHYKTWKPPPLSFQSQRFSIQGLHSKSLCTSHYTMNTVALSHADWWPVRHRLGTQVSSTLPFWHALSPTLAFPFLRSPWSPACWLWVWSSPLCPALARLMFSLRAHLALAVGCFSAILSSGSSKDPKHWRTACCPWP